MTLKLNPEVAAFDPVSFGAEARKVNGSLISPTQLSVQEALFVRLQELNAQRDNCRYHIDYALSPRLQTVQTMLAQYLSLPTVPNDYHILAAEQRQLQAQIKAYQESLVALDVNLRYAQKAYQRNKHSEFVVPEEPVTLDADGNVVVREVEEEADDGTDRWVTWVGGGGNDNGTDQSAEVSELTETMGAMGGVSGVATPLEDVAEVEDENCMDETDSKDSDLMVTHGMNVTDDGQMIEAYIEDEDELGDFGDDDQQTKQKQKDDDSYRADGDRKESETEDRAIESRDQEQRKKKKRKRRKRGKKKTNKAKQKS